METTTELNKFTEPTTDPVSYVNRMGREYFVHQGLTKTGKPKYFASQKREGAITRLPHGFVFGESINGIVTIQRPKPPRVPETDIVLVKQKVAVYQHLKHYRVEVKDKTILIYEPMGLESVDTLAKSGSFSTLDNLKSMLGSKFEDALAKAAKEMGITVSDLKHADALSVEERRKTGAAYLIRNIQYDAVMKFTIDPVQGPYRVERRCYRGKKDWVFLGCGTLEKMLKQFVRHIGKESFFELI